MSFRWGVGETPPLSMINLGDVPIPIQILGQNNRKWANSSRFYFLTLNLITHRLENIVSRLWLRFTKQIQCSAVFTILISDHWMIDTSWHYFRFSIIQGTWAFSTVLNCTFSIKKMFKIYQWYNNKNFKSKNWNRFFQSSLSNSERN